MATPSPVLVEILPPKPPWLDSPEFCGRRRVPDRLVAHGFREFLGGFQILHVEGLDHFGIGEKGLGAFAVDRRQLRKVLKNRPELDAIAGHQAHAPAHLVETPERREFIEEEQNRPRRPLRRPREIAQGGVDHQAQPSIIGFEAIGRQHDKDRGDAGDKIGEGKIRARQRAGDAGRVQKLGMALRRRDHPGEFDAGLAEEAPAGARDQAVRALEAGHFLQKLFEGFGRQGQILPHPVEIARFRLFACGDIHDDSGNQGLGLIVPMAVFRVAAVQHEGVGESRGVFGEIEAVGAHQGERIEGGDRLARDLERIEDEDRAEGAALAGGDFGVFALGVDHEHRAVGHQQIGNDRAHPLAGARRRDGQQMAGAGIIEQRPFAGLSPGVQPIARLFDSRRCERVDLGVMGEAGAAEVRRHGRRIQRGALEAVPAA